MPAPLSSASGLLSGWSPPEYGGRVVSRVEKIGGNRRRIVFLSGRAKVVTKQDIARLARQKGTIVSKERYAKAPTRVKRQISHKSGQRQKNILRRYIARLKQFFKRKTKQGDILPQKAWIKRAMQQLEGANVGSLHGRRASTRRSAREAIDAAWKEAGIDRPKDV